jgi:hypothetical protein
MYQAAIIAASQGFLACEVTSHSVCKAFEQLSIPVLSREMKLAAITVSRLNQFL